MVTLSPVWLSDPSSDMSSRILSSLFLRPERWDLSLCIATSRNGLQSCPPNVDERLRFERNDFFGNAPGCSESLVAYSLAMDRSVFEAQTCRVKDFAKLKRKQDKVAYVKVRRYVVADATLLVYAEDPIDTICVWRHVWGIQRCGDHVGVVSEEEETIRLQDSLYV